ncbi:uncharacterized protein METZ01_LOCUS465119, partial [marine metagenome]
MNRFWSSLESHPAFRAALLCLGFLVTGCATAPEETPAEVVEIESQEEPEQAVEAEPRPRPEPEDYPVAPFEGDSLYQLLVAEIAGYRSHYDVALEKYILTAEETRDPGVAGRAVRMALYLKNDDAALRAVKIWTE